jgi:NlpC/P60 family putative phage cell wall peptidase
MTITREQIVAEARTWLGTKYRHQGRVKGLSVDCVGLVFGVAAALGVPHQPVSDYSRRPDGTLLPGIEAQTAPVTGAPAAGDIVVFQWAAEPMHVAILTAPDHIIHAFAINRVVCEHRIDERWQRRVACFRAFPGVA